MKGMKELVKSLVLEVKGTFEEDRRYSIREYRVSGITVKRQLYPSDEKERYFHIFYNGRKKAVNMKQSKQRSTECQNVSTSMKEKNMKWQGALPDTLT